MRRVVQQKLHKQQRKNTCVLACLRTVLDLQYGVRVSEEALEILGTDPVEPIKQHGTSTVQLRRIVKRASAALNAAAPWRLFVRLNGTLDDLAAVLAKGSFPLVAIDHGVLPDWYHMVVVLEVTETKVRVWDPAPDEFFNPFWMGVEQFDTLWADETGMRLFCAVTGTYKRVADEAVSNVE